MKFIIHDSDIYNDKKPHDAAFRGKVTKVNWFHAHTLGEARESRWGASFFSEGVNHRAEKGKVMRDEGEKKVWFIELATCEELAAFMAENVATLYCQHFSQRNKEGYLTLVTSVDIFADDGRKMKGKKEKQK